MKNILSTLALVMIVSMPQAAMAKSTSDLLGESFSRASELGAHADWALESAIADLVVSYVLAGRNTRAIAAAAAAFTASNPAFSGSAYSSSATVTQLVQTITAIFGGTFDTGDETDDGGTPTPYSG